MTPSERPEPMYLEYYPIETKVSFERNATSGSDAVCNSSGPDKTDSDITLHLGYFYLLWNAHVHKFCFFANIMVIAYV